MGSGFESLQKRVEPLGRRLEEFEGERRKAKDSRRMTESSSGSEEGGGPQLVIVSLFSV